MILYVNGDSHAAAAEAVNPYSFAEDDPDYYFLGRRPHPDNLAVSWAHQLSVSLNLPLHLAAESASSNTRIMRTTRAWLAEQAQAVQDTLVVIQWSTWEREEWLHNGIYYQVNASGIDHVPPDLVDQYKNFIADLDWPSKTREAHDQIWAFHQELKESGVRHIFVNGNTDFSKTQNRQDWGTDYIGPYNPALTYDAVVRSQKIETVAPKSYHFGKDGHSVFHRFMLQYIIENKYI
jgi:hypothetical protein